MLPLGPGDDHRRADRAAALAHHGTRGDVAAEEHAHAAPLVHLAVDEQAVGPLATGRARQAPDERESGDLLVPVLQERADGERVGVHQQRRDRVVGLRRRQPTDLHAVLGALGGEPERADPNPGEHRGPCRHRRAVLHPAAVADHAARRGADGGGRATDLHRPPAGRLRELRNAPGAAGDEHAEQVGGRAVQCREGLRDGDLGRSDDVGTHGEAVAEPALRSGRTRRACPGHLLRPPVAWHAVLLHLGHLRIEPPAQAVRPPHRRSPAATGLPVPGRQESHFHATDGGKVAFLTSAGRRLSAERARGRCGAGGASRGPPTAHARRRAVRAGPGRGPAPGRPPS